MMTGTQNEDKNTCWEMVSLRELLLRYWGCCFFFSFHFQSHLLASVSLPRYILLPWLALVGQKDASDADNNTKKLAESIGLFLDFRKN